MLHPELSALVSVVVLCAKVDEKTRIVSILREYFQQTKEILDGYPTFILEDENSGVVERLIVADCGMANVSAASKTGYIAARFTPNLIVFVGTGGALKPDKCQIFDVVVPTLGATANYYDKLTDGIKKWWWWSTTHKDISALGAITKDRRTYNLRPKAPTFELIGVGTNYVSKAKSISNGTALRNGLVGDTKNPNPNVHLDNMVFSWDMVLASEHYRKLLASQIDDKAIIIDMESYGFLSALKQFEAPPVNKAISSLIVRGISDDCTGESKDKSYQSGRNDTATDNAAHVACRIIKYGYLTI